MPSDILLVIFLFLLVAAIIQLISMSWTHLRGAPWLPTPIHKVRKMLALADLKPDELLYDLGCGDGRVLVIAARRFGARAVGIELDPLRYLWCRMLIAVFGLRDRVQIIFGDFFSQDLSQADVVTCYLLQGTNDRLQSKLQRELKPEARVVSHAFVFSALTNTGSDSRADIYVYRVDKEMEVNHAGGTTCHKND
jgi:ribosomal protein L11 methylase PrmA